MKKTQLILLFSLAFTSCKKGPEIEIDNSPKGCQLTEFGTGSPYNIKLEYDESGRVSKVYKPDFADGGYIIEKYHYESNKIIVKHDDFREEFNLQDGKIIGSIKISNYPELQNNVETQNFTYTGDKQLNYYQFKVNSDVKFKDYISYKNSNYLKSTWEMNTYKIDLILTSGSGQYFPFNTFLLAENSGIEIFFDNLTHNILYEMGYFGEKSKKELLSFSRSGQNVSTASKVLNKDSYGNVTQVLIEKENPRIYEYKIDFKYSCK